MHFQQFHDIVTDYSHVITHESLTDSNRFCINGHTCLTHIVYPLTDQHVLVLREDLPLVVSAIKGQCTATTEMLSSQLDRWFPNCDILEALRMVFVEY